MNSPYIGRSRWVWRFAGIGRLVFTKPKLFCAAAITACALSVTVAQAADTTILYGKPPSQQPTPQPPPVSVQIVPQPPPACPGGMYYANGYCYPFYITRPGEIR